MTHTQQQRRSLAYIWLLIFLSGCATEWSGRVVSVADGDTLSVLHHNQRVRIRLHGVDTPETRQPFGPRAKRFTRRLALGQIATIRPVDRDRYGRTVAKVFVRGEDLNAKLLEAGLAWHYRRYDNTPHYVRLEAQARAARRGLWSQPRPTAPWIWRRSHPRRHKRRVSRNPPTCAGHPCRIHGNRRSHVFHRRGCRHFNCKQCTLGFETPDQARAAGYHPHRDCK
jgi:micrococcal nuclease